MSTEGDLQGRESRIIWLLTCVSFVNILDFMMVMPLGPDFAVDLGIPTSRLGLIGGSYTFAAALAGLAGMTFLDRFDRKKALMFCIVGLAAGTLTGAFAQGFHGLLAARLLAGAFGGPATSLGMAIVADTIPAERRGKALGTVMGAFAAASVLGVPLGLELARLGSWRLPFVAVAVLALGAAVGIWRLLPTIAPGQRQAKGAGAPPLALDFLRQPGVVLALSATAIAFFGNFALIPNLSTFLQHNLGYPRESLGTLYLVGGAVSFAAMRLGGAWVDRGGPNPITIGASVLLFCLFGFGFVPQHSFLPVIVIFVGFMLASSLRGVALNTLSSKVPSPETRARYMSADSAVKHLAAAAGAALSAAILVENADHSLGGMAKVAGLAMATTFIFPILIWRLSLRIGLRHNGVAASPSSSGRVV